MADRTYLTALFDDAHAASGAIPALAGCGILPDDMCLAADDPAVLSALCTQTGAIPMDCAIAQQLQEAGISIERAAHCEEAVNAGSVLLLLPRIADAREIIARLNLSRADVGEETEDDTVRMPLHEEKLEVHKRMAPDGEVRVRKVVTRATQHLEVPVMREDLLIVRVPASGPEETLRIPLRHEEIALRKVVVQTNEVTIRRESAQWIAHVREPVLSEKLEVHRIGYSPAPQSSVFGGNTAGNNSGSISKLTTEKEMDVQDTSSQIRSFFPDRIAAESAADDLRSQGVPEEDIELQTSEGAGFLDGIKRFFSGSDDRGSYERGVILTVRSERDSALPIIERYGGRIAESREAESGTMKLHEERLDVHKEAEKQGEVRLTKEVVTSQKEFDVPVNREEIVLNRRRVDEPDEDAKIGEGEEVRIPVMREEVSVEKHPVITEEVAVEKRDVQTTEHVSASVQKERARLETDGRVGTSFNDVE